MITEKVSGGQSFLASIQNLLIFAIFKSSLNLNPIRHWSENWCPGYLEHALYSSVIHLAAAKSLEINGHVTNCCKRPIQRDFPEYTWSTATLDRRLRHFGIYYINYDTPVAAVADAVQKDLEGPGKLLGYRAMNQKLRTEHNVQVPRHLVYNVMAELDLEGLEARNLQRKKKKEKSKGSLHI